MKQTKLKIVAVVVVVGLGYLAAVSPWDNANAQEQRMITVEIDFRPTSGDLVTGDPCGYTDIQTAIWPHSKQVVVTDATGIVVGTVDLLNVFNPTIAPVPPEAQPGIINDEGTCKVSRPIEVGDSPFYTFMIDGFYKWTVSSDDLAQRDWVMPVWFY